MPAIIDPAAPILWLLRGGKLLTPIPLVKMVLSAGALGATVGTYLGEHTRAQNEAGIYMALGQAVDLYSPEIQKYEFSALGSTRII